MAKKKVTRRNGADGSPFRTRIKELRYVRAKELLANPKNFRRHPESQRTAMRSMLERVGFANATLAYEDEGKLTLIDGHLRQELEPEQMLPVLVLDVNASEANELLATLDPLGAMAQADLETLKALKAELPDDLLKDETYEELQEMLNQLEVEAAVLSGGDMELDSNFDVDSLVDEDEVADKPGLYTECPTCEQKIKRKQLAAILQRKRSRPPKSGLQHQPTAEPDA